MKTYFSYLKINLKAQIEHRLAFLMMIFSQSIGSVFSLLGVYFLFESFSALDSWSFEEVAFMFAVTNLIYNVAQLLFRGLGHFKDLIKLGEVDRLLIRPRSIILQALGGEVAFNKIGACILNLIILIIAVNSLNIDFSFMNILILVLIVLGGLVIFLGVMLIGAAVSIYTIEGSEIANIISYGGKEAMQYPITIYDKWFRGFLTFIVPFATVNYIPLLYLLGRSNNLLHAFAPLIGGLFVIPCFYIFKRSMSYYTSSGS